MILLDGQKDVYMPVRLLSESSGEAKVYLCENQKAQTVVARICNDLQGTNSTVRQFLYHTECPYIMKLKDHGVVELYGKKCFFEIFDYMPEGTWNLQAPIQPQLVEAQLIPSLNEGLHCFHEAGLLHRDVKPDNLYAGKDEQGQPMVVLGDFGISVPCGQDGNYCDPALAFTPGYVPAEVLGGGMYSPASDYYGMGVSLYYLLTGKQIFDGLTPDEIMVKTRRGELADYEGLSERMASLLEGLMIQDPRYRWGYTEVKKWLSGASVPVFRHTQAEQLLDPPYQLTAQASCNSLKELALAMTQNPEEAKRQLYEGLLANGIGQQYPYLHDELNNLTGNVFSHKKQAGLAAAIKLIDPEFQGILWDGTKYAGLNELLLMVRRHLAVGSVNPAVEELMNSGILHYYYGQDLSAEDLASLKQIEKLAEINMVKAQAYLVLHFLPKPVYQIGDAIFIHNMNEYVSYLTQNRGLVKSLLVRDLNHPYFRCFVDTCGYENQFRSWHSYFYHRGRIPENGELIGNASQLLADICPNQQQNLKVFVLDEVMNSPEYWMKDHLNLYEMDEMMERMVHDNFDVVHLDETMSIQELLKEQHRLKECMHELRRDLLNNYALMEQGVYDTAGYRIIPISTDGLFVEDRSGAMVPVGWLKENQGLAGAALIQAGYQAMREEAALYIEENAQKAEQWSTQCKAMYEQKRKTWQKPGLIGGIVSFLCASAALVLLALLSRTHLKDCGIITLAGFGISFLAVTLWLVAGVRRFIKVFMWKRLVRSSKNLNQISDNMRTRSGQFTMDPDGVLKPNKSNLETAAQVERATGSNLLNGYRLKNGLLRYGVTFVLTFCILFVGLAQDGALAGARTDLKSTLRSLLSLETLTQEVQGTDTEDTEEHYTVDVSVARLRSGPGLDYEILNVYEEESIMIPTGEKQDVEEYTWYEVTAPDGNVGWMRSDTIRLEQED